MKIGTKYFYLLRVCREIDEAHLCGLLCDKAHIHWNPNEAPEKPPKKREEPLSLPLPFDVETGETICEK